MKACKFASVQVPRTGDVKSDYGKRTQQASDYSNNLVEHYCNILARHSTALYMPTRPALA
jgi:hypothetical protein